jgi:hypothetical protein
MYLQLALNLQSSCHCHHHPVLSQCQHTCLIGQISERHSALIALFHKYQFCIQTCEAYAKGQVRIQPLVGE